MINQVLAYLGAVFILFLGSAHLIHTKRVVVNFGDISKDNRHVIMMAWITEGMALIFIGALVVTVTFVDAASLVTRAVYWLTFLGLNVLSVVSLFTKFRVSFLPFKLYPVIFTGASILILLGALLKDSSNHQFDSYLISLFEKLISPIAA